MPLGLGEWLAAIGLADLLVGLKFSGISSTKLEGKTPIALLSRHSLPVHHEPSPALRHSIRSPSMKPRSRLFCKYTRIGQSTLESEVGMGWEAALALAIAGQDGPQEGNCSILSSHAPLLPTSRQPEPNKGSASGLVVVREPYLCRVAAGRCLLSGAVGLSGSPSRLHSNPHVHRRGLVWLLCQQSRSATHHLQKQPGTEPWFGRTSGRKQQSTSKAKAYSPNLWTDRPGAAEDGMDPDQTELEL